MADQRLTLVLMAGLRATGKTTIANELSYKLGWPVINRDLVKACLMTARGTMTEDKVGEITRKLALSGPQLRWPIVNTDWFMDHLTWYLTPGVEMTDSKAGEVAYNLSFDLIEHSLVRERKSVILDTGTHLPFILKNAERIALAAGANMKTIHCTVSDDIRCQRLDKREPYPPFMKSRETLSDEEYHIRFHTYSLPADKLPINTNASLEDNYNAASAYVLALADKRNTTIEYASAPSLCAVEPVLAGH